MYETAVVSATEKCSLGAKIRKMSLQATIAAALQDPGRQLVKIDKGCLVAEVVRGDWVGGAHF